MPSFERKLASRKFHELIHQIDGRKWAPSLCGSGGTCFGLAVLRWHPSG